MAIAIISGSSRDNGNTEELARVVTQDLPATWFRLRHYRITPIHDQRHDPDGFVPVSDDYNRLIQELLAYDIWLFASPVYWYGFSGLMKNFIDRWSEVMRRHDLAFSEQIGQKLAALTLVGGDQPHLKALALIQQFYWICDYMRMPFVGYALGEANRPGEIENDPRALATAHTLHQTLSALHKR